MSLVLAINPGGGSTKIAVFDDEACVFKASLPHDKNLISFEDILAHKDDLEEGIMDALRRGGVDPARLDAIVGRGGALKPMESGTYRANDKLASDIRSGAVQAKHASNLGGLLAYDLGARLGKPGFMVDPVSVDEFIAEARLSGLREPAPCRLPSSPTFVSRPSTPGRRSTPGSLPRAASEPTWAPTMLPRPRDVPGEGMSRPAWC
jgi:butyrate kinase